VINTVLHKRFVYRTADYTRLQLNVQSTNATPSLPAFMTENCEN